MNLSPSILTSSLLLLVSALLVHAGGDKAKSTLEGSWIVEKDGIKVQMIFAKNKFSIVFPEGKPVMGTFTTDAAKKPKEIDLTIVDGDPKVKGKKILSIYDVVGDTLKIVGNDPAQENPRATEFPEKEGGGDGYMYLIFKRAKPK